MTRRGGPYPRLRLDLIVKIEQGMQVLKLTQGGASFAAAGAALGLSATTAWRRWWFIQDWTLPGFYGHRSTEIPPQRGTRACPRGRPCLPALDHRQTVLPRYCMATRRDSQPCGNRPRKGGRVCRMHGGSAPQVLARAAVRQLLVGRAERAEHDAHWRTHR
jgi:hypothetical protein